MSASKTEVEALVHGLTVHIGGGDIRVVVLPMHKAYTGGLIANISLDRNEAKRLYANLHRLFGDC